MAHYNPARTGTGWRLEIGEVVIDAESPYRDRGAIRATLTVRRKGIIKHRDSVNLTSVKSRARLIRALARKRVKVRERALIALDEACRTGRDRPEQDQRDGSPDISEMPPLDLAGLLSVFKKWLLIADDALLPVFVGAILAHRLGGEPVWLLIAGPPGATKTELLRSLYGYPGIYALSDLTARTFASGLDRGDPSLLSRVTDGILVLKDFTTILTAPSEEQQAILGQLREIYDGRFDKVWGNARELHWEGRLGFAAGVTYIIDRHQVAMATLGERFVTLRVIMPDRHEMARYALRSRDKRVKMRGELATAMHGFLRSRGNLRPTMDADVLDTLSTVADFITRARSPVHRDGRGRELQYAPVAEAPTRFVKVLASLGSGIALAHDSRVVGRRELRLVLRVALDCVPPIRRQVIDALLHDGMARAHDRGLRATVIAKGARCSLSAVRRALEDLHALRVVRRRKGQPEFTWCLKEQFIGVMRILFTGREAA